MGVSGTGHAERTGRLRWSSLPCIWRERFANDISVAWGTYLRKLRIEAACRAALNSDTPIVEIALRSGFVRPEPPLQDAEAYTGMSPRQFRQVRFFKKKLRHSSASRI